MVWIQRQTQERKLSITKSEPLLRLIAKTKKQGKANWGKVELNWEKLKLDMKTMT